MRYDDFGRSRASDRALRRRPAYDAFRRIRPAPRLQRPGDGHLDDGRYGPARYGLGPYHERLLRRRRSDEELRAAVEEALFYDTWVNADAVTVEVDEGIVTLRGDLPDFDEVRYAVDDTWDVEGVIGVRCDLRVDDR